MRWWQAKDPVYREWFEGAAAAAALGVRVVRPLGEGGMDGRVFLLEDGRVLKISKSPNEAANALAILDASGRGERIPGCPVFHGVWRLPHDRPLFALVRDAMDDVPPPPGVDPEALQEAFLRFDRRMRTARSTIEQLLAVADAAGYGAEMRAARAHADALRERLGIRPEDLQFANLGVGADGVIGLRDLGASPAPDFFIDLVLAEGCEPLPAAPVPQAAPGGR